MIIGMEAPDTLQKAIVYFSDPDRCFEYALNLRWPNGVVSCPRCGSEEHSFIKTRRIWFCKGCKKQFTLKVGTVFEDSPLGLDKWMCAFWMLCNCKNGVSSCEVARALGITQKSAWFMLHRVRKAMGDDSEEKIGGTGPVEIDETFVGGKVKNMHRSKRPKNVHLQGGNGKAVVLGMLERGGRVRTQVIENRLKKTIDPAVTANVAEGSHIITDEFSVYPRLTVEYIHEVINHAEAYVRDHVHTNGIENFWSLLKRGLGGTYISVEPFHLDRYVTEQVFRYNNRKNKNDKARFELAMRNVFGKRLTYAELTGGAGSATAQ
jgi:transposase-like protein